MKKKKKLSYGITLAVLTALVAALFTSCGPNPSGKRQPSQTTTDNNPNKNDNVRHPNGSFAGRVLRVEYNPEDSIGIVKVETSEGVCKAQIKSTDVPQACTKTALVNINVVGELITVTGIVSPVVHIPETFQSKLSQLTIYISPTSINYVASTTLGGYEVDLTPQQAKKCFENLQNVIIDAKNDSNDNINNSIATNVIVVETVVQNAGTDTIAKIE